MVQSNDVVIIYSHHMIVMCIEGYLWKHMNGDENIGVNGGQWCEFTALTSSHTCVHTKANRFYMKYHTRELFRKSAEVKDHPCLLLSYSWNYWSVTVISGVNHPSCITLYR